MLVLRRLPGERIILKLPDGEQIELLVAEVRFGREVRLGIKAPREVRIYREEIMNQPLKSGGAVPSG